MGKLIDSDELWQGRPEYKNENQIGHEEENKGWNDCMKAWHDTIEMTTTVEDVITIDRFKEIVKEETAWMEDEEFIDQFVDEHIDEYLRKRCLCLVDSLYINKLEKSAEEKVYTEAFDKGYAKGVKDTEEAWNRRAKIDEVVDNG